MAATPADTSDHEEGEVVPFVLMPTIPALKFHDTPYHFMSEPGITQQEYQKRVFAHDARVFSNANEIIRVKCPDRPDGAGRVFELQRSVLERSPRLAQFFNSPYYLPGCEMYLTFIVDPAICIEWAHAYLQDGPDLFPRDVLKVKVTMKYLELINRLIILIKLYALAQKLLLFGLMEMSVFLLREWGLQTTAEHCIALSGLIFARDGSFDSHLKHWCMKRVQNHGKILHGLPLWSDVMDKADPELKRRWMAILAGPRRRLAPVVEASNRTPMNVTATRPGSVVTPTTEEQGYQKILDDLAKRHLKGTDSDYEWDIRDALLLTSPDPPETSNGYKINQILGPVEPPPSPRESRFNRLRNSPSTLFSPGASKERFVMGLPGIECESTSPATRVPPYGYSSPLPTPTKSPRNPRQ